MDENKDYTYLKEKNFTVKTLRGVFQGMLVDIEPAIGATIVDKGNRDLYIYCLRGPSVNIQLFKDYPELKKVYERIFDKLVKQIEEGQVILSQIIAPERKFPFLQRLKTSSNNCAFNQ